MLEASVNTNYLKESIDDVPRLSLKVDGKPFVKMPSVATSDSKVAGS